MPENQRQLSLTGFTDGEEARSPAEAQAEAEDAAKDAAEAVPEATAEDTSPDPDVADAASPAPDLAGKQVYLIDAHSLIFQVFHALPEMTSPQGEPVAAIYGFVRDVFFLLDEKQPDYLICAFDRSGPTFRHEIYDAYKANRSEMPEELAVQLPQIRRVLDALGVPALEYEQYEADDILATLARTCDAAGAECYLVTADKDCRQLITDNVKVYNVRKDTVYDQQALADDWGIRPEQVVDFQALVGDSVDNVPGVPLIGPKIARQLIEQYGTLEEVLAHADEVSGAKRRQNLKEGHDQALLSRELVRLVDDIPLEVNWSSAEAGQVDAAESLQLFAAFGFRSLSDKLREMCGIEASAHWEADYKCVDTKADLQALVEQLKTQPRISIDLETTSLWPRWAEPVGYALAFRAGEAYYLPVRAPQGQRCLDPQDTLETLRPVLEDESIEKVGQNLKYDMIVLRAAGVQLAGVAFDTMVASYLLEAGQRNHNLDDLSRRYLDHETIKITSLIGSGKQQKRMDEVPVDQLTDYACEDADVPLRLLPILEARLQQAELDGLLREMELPLIDVLVEMEFNGIQVDTARLAELSQEYGRRLETVETEIYELAGHEFNIASPKQLGEVLFEEQGLPVVKKTKSGASTDAEVLEQLAREHPLPAKIIEYRQFAKLKNTYVDALPHMVHPLTGRVHASFNQVVAATGRLSSSDPNLQNIPIRTESGREIRSAFLPGEPDWQLLAADYSQIELRVLAHCSGDETLRAAFERGEDIHALVASQVYDVSLDDVTAPMRRSAKAVNFGVIYGQSPFGLAKSLDIEVDDAAQFIDAYFEQYPRVDQFLREILDQCRDAGFVSTIFGRRRAIRGIRADTSGRQRNLAERTAINTVIQGSAADLIKRAMIHIHRRLKRKSWTARMLLQIHDELVFEVPPDEVQQLTTMVAGEMEGAAELSVPLKVDIKRGANWAEVEPV